MSPQIITTTAIEGGSVSKSNEEVLYTARDTRTGTSPANAV